MLDLCRTSGHPFRHHDMDLVCSMAEAYRKLDKALLWRMASFVLREPADHNTYSMRRSPFGLLDLSKILAHRLVDRAPPL